MSADEPATNADGQQTRTVKIPRDNRPRSIPSENKVNVTWKSSLEVELEMARHADNPRVFPFVNTAESVPARGENTFEANVGQLFRVYERKQGGQGFYFMVPDGAFEHPDDKKFEATQTIDVPPAGHFAYLYDVPGKGPIECMNKSRNGYATVWTFTYTKDDEQIVDYYVQVVVGANYKVLRNLANRHTVRLYHNGRGEEATPGVKEWKPIVGGGWSKP